MDKGVFLNLIDQTQINDTLVEGIEKKYGEISSEYVKRMISISDDATFFDDKRMIANSEIINACEELHVDFLEKRIIPLIDCGENDFIVYHIKEDKWSKFNIVDECCFKERDSLKAII